ncbi:MAG: hypothetical protein MJA29_05255 [Candidatus Omnitrophica bacterium]|nr:hypothetical protein [Candidatus Omnitrophota bacterium]
MEVGKESDFLLIPNALMLSLCCSNWKRASETVGITLQQFQSGEWFKDKGGEFFGLTVPGSKTEASRVNTISLEPEQHKCMVVNIDKVRPYSRSRLADDEEVESSHIFRSSVRPTALSASGMTKELAKMWRNYCSTERGMKDDEIWVLFKMTVIMSDGSDEFWGCRNLLPYTMSTYHWFLLNRTMDPF